MTGEMGVQTGYDYSVTYSLRNSLLSPYWLFNVLGVAYVTVGMAMASPEHGWDWTIWVLAAVCIWFGSSGSNNIDLSDEELMIDIDPQIQRIVGGVYLLIGVVAGLVVVYLTTWWPVVLIVLGTFLTLAYDLEWFGGLFHDRDVLTGLANFGFTAAWIPVFGSYAVMAQTPDIKMLGMAIFAISPALHLISFSYIEDDLKRYKYSTYGIKHERDVEPDFDRLQRRGATQSLLHIGALSFMAIGLYIMFVL